MSFSQAARSRLGEPLPVPAGTDLSFLLPVVTSHEGMAHTSKEG